MADRLTYLAALQATDRQPFRPKDLAKTIGRESNIVRAWLSKDKKAGLVELTQLGFYRIISKEKLAAEIIKLKRNGATGGSSGGSRQPPKNPQLCRLHNVQFFAVIPGYNVNNITGKVSSWEEKAPGPGTRRWELYPVAMPGTGTNCKIQLSAGKNKASLQIWVMPIFTNSYKLFDQLEAVHDAAQRLVRILAFDYKFSIALLEIKRSEHFAIKIPVRESHRIAKTGFKMVGGKLWVNQDWWIDESYGNELETANEKAFGDLMDGLQKVGGIETQVSEIHSMLARVLNPQPTRQPTRHEPGTGGGETQ
jgi:hypothetical protein